MIERIAMNRNRAKGSSLSRNYAVSGAAGVDLFRASRRQIELVSLCHRVRERSFGKLKRRRHEPAVRHVKAWTELLAS